MPVWESACRLRACSLQWPMIEQPSQDEEEVLLWSEELGVNIAVCPHLQLISHTPRTSTLSRIKCERYIFIKKCVRSFIEVRHYVWLCSACIMYMYVAIQHYSVSLDKNAIKIKDTESHKYQTLEIEVADHKSWTLTIHESSELFEGKVQLLSRPGGGNTSKELSYFNS